MGTRGGRFRDSLEDFGDALRALDLAIAAQEAVQALEELLGVDGTRAHGRKTLGGRREERRGGVKDSSDNPVCPPPSPVPSIPQFLSPLRG